MSEDMDYIFVLVSVVLVIIPLPSYADSLNVNNLCARLKESSSKTTLLRLLRQVGNVRRANFTLPTYG